MHVHVHVHVYSARMQFTVHVLAAVHVLGKRRYTVNISEL